MSEVKSPSADAAGGVTAPAATPRPWLSSYRSEHSSDIVTEWPNALAMFVGQRARLGERPLVHYFGTTMSFAEIDRLSDAFASALHAQGVGAGERVALYLQNVPQFAIAVLATWKLQAIVVAMNPMLRERELRHQLNDSGASVLVCLESLYAEVAARVLPETSVTHVVTTSELDFVGDSEPPKVLANATRGEVVVERDLVSICRTHDGERIETAPMGPDDVALLTYTSGTTGPPKAAMNTHGNIAFNAQAKREWFCLGEDDTILAAAPLFHITGFVSHLALAISAGAPLVLTYRFEPETVCALIERYRPTFSVAAITAYIALMNCPAAATADLSSLTKVYSGGAPIAPSVAKRFEDKFGPRVHNAYGLSETSAATHAMPFGAAHRIDPTSGALSVGVPYFNTIVKVVDDNGAELGPGEIGELVSIGPQIAAGYWGNPEETANAFRKDGFYTGDVGFRDEDGWFYLVDRKKDMIICSGYKVWPREVEDVLYEHSSVSEAAVVGVPDDYRGETVKAFVSLRPGEHATPEELVAFCRERLASYKCPHSVDILDSLPKTLTGKILRRELRAEATATP